MKRVQMSFENSIAFDPPDKLIANVKCKKKTN